MSYRAQPIKYKTDNNKLSTTAMALEKIYTDLSWPPGTPGLASSLRSKGKSRTDLWQLAANTALEIEIAKANWGCTHPATYQQLVVALEGMKKCHWKLQEPVPFLYGRADCVRDKAKATTDYPYYYQQRESLQSFRPRRLGSEGSKEGLRYASKAVHCPDGCPRIATNQAQQTITDPVSLCWQPIHIQQLLQNSR